MIKKNTDLYFLFLNVEQIYDFYTYLLQEFLRSIQSGRRPSLHLEKILFSGTNTGHMQIQKEKQIHTVALSEEMLLQYLLFIEYWVYHSTMP